MFPEPSATQLIIQFLEHSGLVNNNVVGIIHRKKGNTGHVFMKFDAILYCEILPEKIIYTPYSMV